MGHRLVLGMTFQGPPGSTGLGFPPILAALLTGPWMSDLDLRVEVVDHSVDRHSPPSTTQSSLTERP